MNDRTSFDGLFPLFGKSRPRRRLAKSSRPRPIVEALEARIAPAGAILTVELSDNGASPASPGSTIHYSEVLQNIGTAAALNVQVQHFLDTHTNIVPGTLKVSPIAFPDSYTTFGNTELVVGGSAPSNPAVIDSGSLFANDAVFSNDLGTPNTLALQSFQATSANGGLVHVNANGSFTYTPAPGFTGTDTFTYTISDSNGLTSTGTVSIAVSNKVWYVDDSAETNGNGTSTSPFNTLSAFGAGRPDVAGDTIYVNHGSAAYTGGITLQANETLIGEGTPLVVGGITLKAGGTAPTITNAAGAGVTLGSGDTLTGFNIGNTMTGGISGSNFGTLTVGNVAINGTGPALVLSTGTLAGGGFNSITTTSSGTTGISLTNVSGTMNLGSGAISGTEGIAFAVSGGAATLYYSGTITANGSTAVDIGGITGGTVILLGAISDTGGVGINIHANTGGAIQFFGTSTALNTGTNTGVNLATNTGAAIGFYGGGLQITTTSGAGLVATGGGTLEVTGTSNTISTTGSATALQVSDTNIGTHGLTFQSISDGSTASTTGDGIILDTTGTSGGLTVTGTGTTAGTGGTIEHKTGAAGSTTSGLGIYLNDTTDVYLENMQLNDFSHYGIFGNSVTNFGLVGSTVNGTNGSSSGTAANNYNDAEGSVHFTNLLGAALISNSTIGNDGTTSGATDVLRVQNNTGTLTLLDIEKSTIYNLNASATGNNAFYFEAAPGTTSPTMSLMVNGSNFTAARGNLLETMAVGSSTLNVVLTNNNFSNDNSGILSGAGGVVLAGGGTGTNITTNFAISGNTFKDSQSNALTVTQVGGSGIWNGTISGNTFGVANDPDSASPNSSGAIQVDLEGNNGTNSNGTGVPSIIGITGNTIQDYGEEGILLRANSGNLTINATVTGNTLSQPDTNFTFAGVWVDVGSGQSGETNIINAAIGDNSVTANKNALGGSGGPASDADVVLGNENSSGTQLNLSKVGSTATTPTGVIQADNTGNPTVDAVNAGSGSVSLVTTLPAAATVLSLSDTPPQANSGISPATPTPPTSPITPSSPPTPTTPPIPSSSTALTFASFNIGTLPAGESVTVSYNATVINPMAAGVNSVTATTTVSGTNFTTASDSVTTTLNAAPDLEITSLTDGPQNVSPGTSITYNIAYANVGNQNSTGVFLTETLPNGTTLDAASAAAGWTEQGATNTYLLDVGALAAGGLGSEPFIVDVTNPAPSGGHTLSSTATIDDDHTGGTDPNPANNTATVTNTLLAAPDLKITDTDNAGAGVVAGGTVIYTLGYSNIGNQNSTGVTITETVPAHTSFDAAASSVGWELDGGNYVYTVGNLTAGAAAGTVKFAVTVENPITGGATQTVDTATIADDGRSGSDANPANNTAMDTVQFLGDDLKITVSNGAATVPGGPITYTIVASDVGTSIANGAQVQDVFPAGLTAVTYTATATGGATGFTASGSGNINDTAVNMPIGSTITYVATGTLSSSATGTLSNTATVIDPPGFHETTPANNTATDTITLTPQADLSVVKSGPASLLAGGPAGTYSITVKNNGPSDAQNVSLSDLLPAGMTFVSQSETAGPAFTLGNTGGQITDTISTLAAGTSATFTVTDQVNANVLNNAVLSETATVSAATADPSPANNTSAVQTTVSTQADLAVSKTGPAALIAGGTNGTYTITVTNNGPSDAQSVSLGDLLPVGMTFVSQSQTAGTAFTLSNAGGQITDTISTLAAGASATFTVTGHANANVPNGTILNEAATISSSTNDPTPANNSSTVQTTISTQADLAVTKTGPASGVAGSDATYTITVTNNGASDAQNVSLSDLLPAGMTLVSQSQTAGPAFTLNQAGNQITDTISTLAAGATATFQVSGQINADVAQNTILTETATISTTTTDPVTANNSSTVNTTVGAQADLAVTNTGPATLIAGTTATYTITLTNNGASDAQSVSLSDVLPAGLTFVSQSQTAGPAFALGNTGNQITDTIGTLPAGASATFTLTAQSASSLTADSSLSDTATSTTATTDPNPENNSASVHTAIQTQADVSVVKTGPATATAGNNITYNITAANAGPSDAQSVSVTDTLPAGMSLVSFTQSSGPANGGTLPSGGTETYVVVAHVNASDLNGTILINQASISTTTTDSNPGNNTSMVSTTVNAQADLLVTKTGPANVTAGTQATYTITLANNGSSDAQQVSLSDLLPAGMTFVSQSETTGPAFVLGNTGNNISDTIATLPAGASATFQIIGQINHDEVAGTVLNENATVSTTTTDPNLGVHGTSTVQSKVNTMADLSVTNTGPFSAIAGESTGAYTITITNNGPSDAQSVNMDDFLPTGMTLVSQSQTAGSVFTLSEDSNEVFDNIATFPSGASATFTVTGKVAANVLEGTVLTETAMATTATTDSVSTNNTEKVQTTVHAQADLAVTKTGPSTLLAGANGTYTITVTNSGSSDAQNVSLSDLLPKGMTFVSQSETAGPAFTLSATGNQLTDTIATLPAGASATFTVTGQVASSVEDGATLTETASATSSTTDPNSANNSSSVQTVIHTQADLAVAITANQPTVIPGGQIVYTITVNNNGPSDASAASLSDPLPAGFTSDSWTAVFAGGTTGNASGTGAIAETLQIPAGGSATYTVTATAGTANGGTTLSNTASVSSAVPDPNPQNNSATVSTFVAGVDLAVSVDDGQTTVTPGELVTYTLSYTNHGFITATGVTLSEAVPSNAVFDAAHSTAGWGLADGAAAGSMASLALGSLPINTPGTATFAVRIIDPVPAGANQIADTATIQDDGTHGQDITPSDNTSTHTDILNAAPDLKIVASQDIGSPSGPYEAPQGGVVHYTLTYSNIGNQDATGVTLTEHVPANSSFNPAQSSGGWEFAGNGMYQLTVGNLPAAASPDSAVFAVTVNSSVPINVPSLTETASIQDDGSNGADLNPANNTANLSTTLYKGIYAVSTGISYPGHAPVGTVNVYDVATDSFLYSFEPYGPKYKASVRIAVADFNNDGFDDIVTASSNGTGQVEVFNGLTGDPLNNFPVINPFNGHSQKGAYVAAGDVTGDGRPDIIVGSALGGGMVKVYDGVTGDLITSYQPFGKNFTGGVRVAVGALSGKGAEDIVAAEDYKGNKVAVYEGDSQTVLESFTAGGKNYRGGLSVAVGDVTGDGSDQIIVGENVGRPSFVEVFDGTTGEEIGSPITPFGTKVPYGARVAVADLDGIVDIIVGGGVRTDSVVDIYDFETDTLIKTFTAFSASRTGSIFVAGNELIPSVESVELDK